MSEGIGVGFAGRPVEIEIEINEDLLNRVMILAHEQDMTLNEFIEVALINYMRSKTFQ